MTTLRAEPYTLPAADLGPENPLPRFRPAEDDGKIPDMSRVPGEDRRYIGWRTAWRVLPYRMQDGYNREKRVRSLPSLILENDFLRATFLTGLGGRLASLYYKPSKRELLDRNPVFQPGNLALREAWISGGIEWNAGGPPGHHYLTCSPVFAARVEGLEGDPVLRLYEWDRVQGFLWQLDFHLPTASRLLYVRARIINPHPYEIPMYWWTNMGVAEREDVRVLVPAETAFCNDYQDGFGVSQMPDGPGWEMTYPMRAPHAYDFFSRIPDERRHWIAALDGQGSGFFETSTDRLRGRKLFAWGMGAGGRRWQEFLAAPGHAYIEIQAGLTRTQMERLPMEAGALWEWTEAFGHLECPGDRVHGCDWNVAWETAANAVEQQIPRNVMQSMHCRFGTIADRAPDKILSSASGWGALERRRRERRGDQSTFPASLPFGDDTLGPEQAPWITLLETGRLPEADPQQEPGALMVQPEWLTLLESSVHRPAGNHWRAWWHIGNARMEARMMSDAADAWTRSAACHRTGWALRNLAICKQREDRHDEALDLLRQAWAAGPKIAPLAVELARALAEAGLYGEVIAFITGLPEDTRSHERLMLIWADAALATGELDGVESLFTHDFATIREGEVKLTDLWYAWNERRVAREEGGAVDDALRERVRRDCPPPQHIDFRMG